MSDKNNNKKRVQKVSGGGGGLFLHLHSFLHLHLSNPVTVANDLEFPILKMFFILVLTGILDMEQIQLVKNSKVWFSPRQRSAEAKKKHGKTPKQPLTRGSDDGIQEIYQSHGSYKYWK